MLSNETIEKLMDEVVSNWEPGEPDYAYSTGKPLMDMKVERTLVRPGDLGDDQLSVRVRVENLSYTSEYLGDRRDLYEKRVKTRPWWSVERRYVNPESGHDTTEFLGACKSERAAVAMCRELSLENPDWDGLVVRNYTTMRPSTLYGHFGFETPKLTD